MIDKEIEHALTITDLRQRYEYIYDAICDYMDKEFREKNHCDFREDNMCFVNREKLGVNPNMGCCYTFWTDFFMNTRDKKLCPHLNTETKSCEIKCITCKLHTCQYLMRKKGVHYDVRKFPGLRKIFNRNQIEVLRFSPFKPKDQIIDKLLKVKRNKLPFFLFYLFNSAPA
jgi:hypothetical protein